MKAPVSDLSFVWMNPSSAVSIPSIGISSPSILRNNCFVYFLAAGAFGGALLMNYSRFQSIATGAAGAALISSRGCCFGAAESSYGSGRTLILLFQPLTWSLSSTLVSKLRPSEVTAIVLPMYKPFSSNSVSSLLTGLIDCSTGSILLGACYLIAGSSYSELLSIL